MRTLAFQRVLGSGAFGAVYLAELSGDRGFRRTVAVKVLLSEHAQGSTFLARVRDEARLLGLLQDEHILEVIELAKVDGREAVLMEYVEGADLSAVIEGGTRAPPRAVAELGGTIAGALHHAHRARHPRTNEPLNVIHRDVKPGNVMITERGGVKLLDFGVARARFEARESKTGQFVLGTLNYMAPEYIVTGEVSPAADVYGLALTVWEIIVGDVFGQPRLKPDLHRVRLEESLARVPAPYAPLVPLLREMLAWEPRGRPDAGDVEKRLFAIADELRGAGLRAWAGEVVPPAVQRQRARAQDTCGLLGRSLPLQGPAGLGAADTFLVAPSVADELAPPPDPSASVSVARSRAAQLPGGGRAAGAAAPLSDVDDPTMFGRATAIPGPPRPPDGLRSAPSPDAPQEATLHSTNRPAFLDRPDAPRPAPPPPPPRTEPPRAPSPPSSRSTGTWIAIVAAVLIGGGLAATVVALIAAFFLYRSLG